MSRSRHGAIPTTVDLGVALIYVKMVDRKTMRDESDWEAHEELAHGLWDPETDTIYIAKWIGKWEQRWALLHELQHACLDLRDYYDRRVRRLKRR